jgi:16S rRNA processing protein RimM
VRRVHGVRGEVRTDPCGGDMSRFTRGLRVGVENSDRQLTVRSVRDGGEGSLLLAFDEIDNAEAAQTLHGTYLYVDAAAARDLGPDEWFTWQLTGLNVVDMHGHNLGVVTDVEQAVSSDVLVIQSNGMTRRYPMVRAFVKSVDVAAGVVTLQPQDEDES